MTDMIGIPMAHLAVASHLLVAGTGTLPTIDVKSLCQKGARVLSQGTVVDAAGACQQDELAARDEIIKNWATYPPADRSACIQPASYLPSYVEWLTCLEISRDVARLRKEPLQTVGDGQAGRRTSRKGGARTGAYECPVVHWRVDGTIDSVDAC
jgi:hypothetical protein